MRFLGSRYLLFLVLAILAIEILIRIGAYEPIASPDSHAGITVKLKRAVSAFGKEKINVVTMGDSRAVQGFDNRLIYTGAKKFGLNHVRLSMPGSHFLTFETLAAWSVADLPALRGIVLAVSPDIFGKLGNGAYELSEVLPLRNSTSIRAMMHHVPFKRSDLRTYTPFYSVAGYRTDIQQLLAAPRDRLKSVRQSRQESPLSFLAYDARESSDICAVATSDPAACLQELQRRGAEIPEKARAGLSSLCQGAMRKRKIRAPGSDEQELIREWTAFLRGLSRKVRVMVVLLPDHSEFVEHMYPPNAAYVANAVLGALDREGAIRLVDLSDLIVRQPAAECRFFMDGRHLNSQGKQVLTGALLPELEKFWRQMD